MLVPNHRLTAANPLGDNMTNRKWGFLRETSEKAKLAGIDKGTGLHRSGIDEYLIK